jgi:HAD superfamily hydrolase (TIGR01509 family)
MSRGLAAVRFRDCTVPSGRAGFMLLSCELTALSSFLGKYMKFEAVLFDCDGVLVDSEHITNGVLSSMLTEMGWIVTPKECMQIFLGKLLQDEVGLIEAKTGNSIEASWFREFNERRNAALMHGVKATPHVTETLDQLNSVYGTKLACVSGADRGKVVLQLTVTGLLRYFEGRIFSGLEVGKSKPAPDVYLAAVEALGVAAARCVVIEDTVTGAVSGVAAGCTVLAYCPSEDGHASPKAMFDIGARHVFTSMKSLPSLVI